MPVSGNQAAKPWDGVEGKHTVQSVLPAEILYCSVGLVSFPMDFTGFTEYRLTMKRLATRIDARSRDSWPAAHGSFLCGLPRRSGKGDLLNFLRGLAAKNSQDDELGLLRLQHIGTRTSGRSMLGVRKIIILPCYLLE